MPKYELHLFCVPIKVVFKVAVWAADRKLQKIAPWTCYINFIFLSCMCFCVVEIPDVHGLSPEWRQTDVWLWLLGGRRGLWPGWFPHAESEFYCDDLWWCHLWSKPHCHLWSLPRNTHTWVNPHWRKVQQNQCWVLPMAMKLRFSWTLRQDTSVGLFPGIAGKILVHRGFPLSLLSKFQTFICKGYFKLVERTGMTNDNSFNTSLSFFTHVKKIK